MLTDSKIRSAKKQNKPYRLTDSKGLYIHVSITGSKNWYVRFVLNDKKSQVAIGSYPDMSLAEARIERDQVKKLVKAGHNPVVEKKRIAEPSESLHQNNFETVARNWHKSRSSLWTPHHAKDVLHSLEKDIFPALGSKPLNEITAPMVLNALKMIEARGAIETAHRIRQRMSDIFVFGIANGLCENNPAAIIAPALLPVKRSRQPAIIELKAAHEMLKRVDEEPAHPITKLALRFLLLTVVRPGELRFAKWDQFEDLDTDNPVWRIPSENMKMKREHVVPLSPMAVEVLKILQAFSGNFPYAFPNTRALAKPMSENALGYLLNRAGYHKVHVPHGFRAMFSSIMNEQFPQDRHVIDLALAHAPKDQVEGAYNRTTHFERRKVLAKEWEKIITQDLKPVSYLVTGLRKKAN